MTPRRDSDLAGALFGIVGLWPMALAILGGAGCLALSALKWLKEGNWVADTARTAFTDLPLPLTSYVGLNRILEWALSVPLFVALPVAGILWAILAGMAFSALSKSPN